MLVIKVGGGGGNNIDPVIDDLTDLWKNGIPWVLVHGGSEKTNEIATALGYPPEFVTSKSGYTSRRTDENTIEIFTMVYAGMINKEIVQKFQERGVNAVGLSGLDGRLMEGPRKKAIRVVEDGRQRIIRADFTGKVAEVNISLINMILENGYAPVISPPAISNQNETINVDGDRAAAAIAAQLGAENLVLLTGAPGVLENVEQPESVIRAINLDEIDQVISGSAKGRMRIKLLAAREALSGGVKSVFIAASNIDQPVQSALGGIGTYLHGNTKADLVTVESTEGRSE